MNKNLTIKEAFGENVIGMKGVKFGNKVGFYIYREYPNGMIIRETISEIESEESLKDICKDLDIDWHESAKGIRFGRKNE